MASNCNDLISYGPCLTQIKRAILRFDNSEVRVQSIGDRKMVVPDKFRGPIKRCQGVKIEDGPDLNLDGYQEEKLSIFIFNTVATNILHFLYDSFAVLQTYYDIKMKSDHPVLLVAEKEKISSKLEQLKDLTIGTNIDQDDLLTHLIGFDELEAKYKNTIFESIYDTCGCWRKRIPGAYERFYGHAAKVNEYALANYNCNYHDKIYISRRPRNNAQTICSERALVNEDQLVEFLVQQGYKEIYLEDYSMTEKIAVLQHAKYIVMQSSASGIFLSYLTGGPREIIYVYAPYRFTHYRLLPGCQVIEHKFKGRVCGKPNGVNSCFKIRMDRFQNFFWAIESQRK